MSTDDLKNKLNELKKGYLKKLEDILANLKNLLSNEKIDIEELYSNIHKISGTSGIYGLSEISNISTEFEFYLKEIKNGITIIKEQELRTMLLEYIENIDAILDIEC